MTAAPLRVASMPPDLPPVHRVPVVAGGVLVVLGVTVLAGWVADLEVIVTVVPGLVAMRPLTALGLVALGVLLLMLAPWGEELVGPARVRRGVGVLLAVAVAALGVATIAQELTGTDWGYEALLDMSRLGADTGLAEDHAEHASRPPIATALCLTLLGGAAVALLADRVPLAQWLAFLGMVVALLSTLAFAFEVDEAFRITHYTTMAVHTSLAVIVAGVGMLHLRPDRGFMALAVGPGAGGMVLRRVLPVMVVGPAVIGLTAQVGVENGWYSERFSMAATLGLICVGGGVLIWRQAAALERTDDRRVDAETALARIRRAESDRAQAMHRLEVANADLERFAAIAAHDLRAPLTTIRGYAEIIADSPVVAGDPESAALATRIERLVERGTEMIDDLLTYSRSGLANATLDTLPLQPLAELIAAEVEEATEREVKIEVLELPAVVGETGQLKQLFHNLLGNAVKYCPHERVPHVVVDALPPVDGHVTVRVTDNGLGIPEAERETLFAIFQRGTRTTDIAGSGVGLAICERIVGRHGGRIWVEDAPGPGSRFCFTLAQRLG